MLINYVFKIGRKDQLRWVEIQILFLLVFFTFYVFILFVFLCVWAHMCDSTHVESVFPFSHMGPGD